MTDDMERLHAEFAAAIAQSAARWKAPKPLPLRVRIGQILRRWLYRIGLDQ